MAATASRRAKITAEIPPSASNPVNSSLIPTTTNTPAQFYHTISKLAISQILRSSGFKSAKSSALETLTRIATLFLQSLATSAASHAAFSCNRTHCNIFDVVHAIEHLSLPFGFPGASDINQTLSTSKTLENLRHFVDASDEPLFPRRIPRRVISSESSMSFPSNNEGKTHRGPEIPRWLPEFPALVIDTGTAKGEKKEVLWEERRIDCRPSVLAKIGKGKKEVVLLGRRERVKFKLGVRRTNVKMEGLDDLELRNGVCRGGKRVCLIKRVDNIRRFFKDDDEKV